MKKIFLLITGLMMCQLHYGQTFSYNTGITQPVPSISSLAGYTNVPVSIQTGIPNISYPLADVPTSSSAVTISLGLNYHAGNVSRDLWSGELGAGWSLLGQGVISRDIYDDPDESFDDNTKFGYIKNDFDDIYNYSIPGESGRFRIMRNTADNSFRLVKLTETTSKIEYHRNTNESTLVLDSFTITNDRGIKYKFETYNFSTTTVWRWGFPNMGIMYARFKYRSAFFLTSIQDENNQELAKFIYFRDLTYPVGMGNAITESESNKLSRIEIKDRGIIELGYEEKEFSPRSDKFRLKSITLKTADNQFVSKHTFELNGLLTAVNKVDADGTVLEKTKYGYNSVGMAAGYPPPLEDGPGIENIYGAPVLNTVQPPTGGIIQYNFEFVPYFSYEVDKIIPAPTEDIGSTVFDQFSSTDKKYFFTLSEEKEVTVDVPAGSLAGYLWTLIFYKKVGSTYQATPYSLGTAFSDNSNNFPEKNKITMAAGEYYASLSSTTAGSFPGGIEFSAVKTTGEPTQVKELKSYHRALPRVTQIKHYNVSGTDFNATSIPIKTEEYSYNKFDDPGVSSSYFVEGGSLTDGLTPANPVMIYKNVKVSGSTEGFTKYYFKTIDAYPVNGSRIIPNYTLTRDGLLEKKEVYNALNKKLSEDIFEYTPQDYSPTEPYRLANNGTNYVYTITAWMKNETVTSRNYFDSGFSETKRETFRNENNFRTNLERETSSNGVIQETAYKYALDKNIQKLITANMFGIPLETAVTIKKNTSDAGKIVSKKEIKYDAANLFPSSVLMYDIPNNTVSTEIVYDRYDSRGNLEQYTTKEGIPVTVVWGYHKTQPIAKIEGASYGQISAYTADITAKSDADTDAASEKLLVDALDAFGNNTALADYLITTYVYDPLTGMKSMTPPSGIREMYQYDNAGRLKQVVDEEGKVLKKYKYNYKQ
ncbi:hypothetical protein M2347_000002 [Chryseobacterium sp. H1D6B]|uniref:hypothetical protein n=1 Tax=Chryseobacterium sp. H1D6B TaxID=2940588 RepID=UPI0015CAE6DC|nr:hypothetical protein [Chryseobacterium sp. H1D6B]MDH6250275.1 hypothetical protein [Chryseobacterium sp. H1D6B]